MTTHRPHDDPDRPGNARGPDSPTSQARPVDRRARPIIPAQSRSVEGNGISNEPPMITHRQIIESRVANGIHAYAYDFYEQGRLDEAEAFFRFLCLYDFYNADYAMGLAVVFQLQGRHRQAVDLYGVAMRLGFSDPRPVFHAGQCFLKLGEIEDARECFAYTSMESSDASLKERAAIYLASLGEPASRGHSIYGEARFRAHLEDQE